MDIQEYPKALYRKGAYIAVQDKAEEEAQRAEGFTDWHTDQKGMKGKADAPAAPAAPVPTDPPAASETPVVPPDAGGAEQPELSRDELKAKAQELGLTYPRNISTEKLAELVNAV